MSQPDPWRRSVALVVREAILNTLEECNLIRRHRGGESPSASFAENVS